MFHSTLKIPIAVEF